MEKSEIRFGDALKQFGVFFKEIVHHHEVLR